MFPFVQLPYICIFTYIFLLVLCEKETLDVCFYLIYSFTYVLIFQYCSVYHLSIYSELRITSWSLKRSSSSVYDIILGQL